MSLVGFNFFSSSHPSGVDPDLFERELDDAWGSAVTFEIVAYTVANVGRHGRATMGNLQVSTVEDLDAGQIAAFDAAVAAHSPSTPVQWLLDDYLPIAPHVGQTLYLSDVAREGGGTGALCWFDGSIWRRVSDNATAST